MIRARIHYWKDKNYSVISWNVETPCRQMGTWEERGYGFARKNVQVSGTCELKLIPRTCWQFRANSLQIKSVKIQLRFFKQNKNGHASFQKVKSAKKIRDIFFKKITYVQQDTKDLKYRRISKILRDKVSALRTSPERNENDIIA